MEESYISLVVPFQLFPFDRLGEGDLSARLGQLRQQFANVPGQNPRQFAPVHTAVTNPERTKVQRKRMTSARGVEGDRTAERKTVRVERRGQQDVIRQRRSVVAEVHCK